MKINSLIIFIYIISLVSLYNCEEEIYFDDGTEEFMFIADMDKPIKLLNITATDILASAYHSGLINDKNELYHWGLFSNIVSEAPNLISISKDNSNKNNKIKQASLGGNFILMLTKDNDLYSMGKGLYGVLGLDKDIQDQEVPKRVEALKNRNIVSLSSGYEHSVVTTDKGLYSWGRADKGQLGMVQQQQSKKDEVLHNSKPQFIENSNSMFRNIKKVCSGSDHSLVLNNDGSVYSWGHGYFGATGQGKKDNLFTPTKLEFDNSKLVEDIACGGYHSMLLTSDNEIYSWGWGEYGQLGHGENDTKNYYSPKKIENNNNNSNKIKSIYAGNHATSFYIDSNGDVYSWGWGEAGSLGHGDNQNVAVPTKIKSLSNITKIAAGFKHTIALTNDGEVYVFGDNTFGQLGTKQNNIFNDQDQEQNDNNSEYFKSLLKLL